MTRKPRKDDKFIAVNRRARYDYAIEEEFEAGLVLTGSEVKSLREGRVNIAEGYVGQKGGELFLMNANIPEYKQAKAFNHEPKRLRKLLLKKREMGKLLGAIQQKGMTIVPMNLYFNQRGYAKLKIGLGKGKKEIDKRDTIKKREWNRQKERLMKS